MGKPKYRGGCKKSEQREDKRDQGSLRGISEEGFSSASLQVKINCFGAGIHSSVSQGLNEVGGLPLSVVSKCSDRFMCVRQTLW